MKERNKTHAENIVVEIGDEIRVRQDEIAELLTPRKALIELYGIETYQVTEAGQGMVSNPDRSAVKKTNGRRRPAPKIEATSPRPSPLHSGEGETRPALGAGGAAVELPVRSPDMVKLMVTARKCPEPFTTESLAVATGLDGKTCGNFISRSAMKGWLVKVERGTYKRSATYPAE